MAADCAEFITGRAFARPVGQSALPPQGSLADNSRKGAAEEIVTDFNRALGILENRGMDPFGAPVGRPRKAFRSAPMIGCGRAAIDRSPFHAAVDPNVIDHGVL